MKKFWFPFVVAATLVSCTQTEMKQTTDTIKQADSLFKTAKEGYKTLDSISAIVKDSARFNKVVVPEIEKQKKSVEEVIRNSTKSIDSVNAVIKKTTDQINKSANVIKTVDSAREALKNSKNPIDALSTISKTLEKVSKTTKNNSQQTSPSTPPQEPQVTQPQQPDVEEPAAIPQPEPVMTNPLVKTARMTIAVNNLENTRSDLATELYKYGGEIVTESFGEEQGFRKQHITAKVPYKYFEEAAQNIAQRIGTLRTKNIETEGKDYNPNQMCDLEITFTEDSQYTSNESITNSNSNTDESYGTKSSDAFMKGFDGLKNVFLFLLPFWPLLLIGGIGYYFYRKNKRKRDEALVEAKLQEQKRYRESTEENVAEESAFTKKNPINEIENPDDPYAKYKPKS